MMAEERRKAKKRRVFRPAAPGFIGQVLGLHRLAGP